MKAFILLAVITFITAASAQESVNQRLVREYTSNNKGIHDLLKDAEFRDIFNKLNLESFSFIASVHAPAEKLENRYLVASGCMPHNCPGGGGVVVIDSLTGGVLIIQKELDFKSSQSVLISRENDEWTKAHGYKSTSKIPQSVKNKINEALMEDNLFQ